MVYLKVVKKIQAVITLSPSTCYYMRTGKCSLNVVTDFYVSHSARISANDLLYCPRLYRAMNSRERMKPISMTPCECGHAEVISGHQRACIAAQKGMKLAIQPVGDQHEMACSVCGGQITFDKDSGRHRVIGLRISLDDRSLARR